jgi:hypothetical protein
MAVTKVELPRYDIRQVSKMVELLEHWIDSSNETLDNENNKDSPNQDRIDTLESRVEALENAKDALEGIE